jgi:hypothetical protein
MIALLLLARRDFHFRAILPIIRTKWFGLKPKRLAADTAYGTRRFLGWLVGGGIAPHIPVRDASEREDGTFSRSDFRWDKRRGAFYLSKQQSAAYHRHRARRQHAPPPWLQIRLRCLRAMLSEYGCPTGTP